MRALLLAAGFGTRLEPLTKKWPKCLMPINGIPLLEYWIKTLIENGINKIYINTYFHKDIVEDFLKRPIFKNVVEVLSESELLGTAGTLSNILKRNIGDSLFVAHADNYCSCNFNDFIKFHFAEKPQGSEITMMTFKTDDPSSCGIVEVNNDGVVVNFYEKIKDSHGNLANGAVFIIDPTAFKKIIMLKDVKDISADIIPHFITKIATWHNCYTHRDIGTIENLIKSQQDFRYKKIKKTNDDWNFWFQNHEINQLLNAELKKYEEKSIDILKF